MEYGCLLWIGSFLPILFRPLSNEVNFSDFVIHHWQTYKKKWKKSIILLTIDLGCDIIIKRSRCRSGGIGRRPGLKIPWDLSRIGSSPISGTTLFMPAATYILYRGVEQLVARRAHNPEAGGSSPPPATMLCNQKRYCTGKPRNHTVSGLFRTPIFKCKQKDIFLCWEDLNYRPPLFQAAFERIFLPKAAFFSFSQKIFSKRSSPACSGKRFALHFRANLSLSKKSSESWAFSHV